VAKTISFSQFYIRDARLLLSGSRNTIQVKTHAQVVLKRLQEGEDIFAELNSCSRHILDCCHESAENKQFYGIHEVNAASALLSLRHTSGSTTEEDPEDSVDD
jgi:hypothetical protein